MSFHTYGRPKSARQARAFASPAAAQPRRDTWPQQRNAVRSSGRAANPRAPISTAHRRRPCASCAPVFLPFAAPAATAAIAAMRADHLSSRNSRSSAGRSAQNRARPKSPSFLAAGCLHSVDLCDAPWLPGATCLSVCAHSKTARSGGHFFDRSAVISQMRSI